MGSLTQLVAYGAADYYLTGNPQIIYWDIPFNKEEFIDNFIKQYKIPIEEFNKFVNLIQTLQKLINTKEDSKFPLEKKLLMIWINLKDYLLPNEMWILIFSIEEKEHMEKISDIEFLIENYKEGYFIQESDIGEIDRNIDKLV